MAKGANVDKLAAEFADELDNLGVRVANLEKKADNVKITGNARYRYYDSDLDGNYNKLRSRIWFNGQVNEDWSYTGMIQNEQNFDNNAGDEDTKFQRAYDEGKLGGLQVTAGRYNAFFGNGNIYDTRADGVEVAYGKDVKVRAFAGKAADGVTVLPTIGKYVSDFEGISTDNGGKYFGGEVSTEIAKGLNLTAGYIKFKDMGEGGDEAIATVPSGIDNGIWHVGAEYAIGNVALSAMYLKGDLSYDDEPGVNDAIDEALDDDGIVIGLSYKGAKAAEAGSYGIWAKYYDQGAQTYVAHTTDANTFGLTGFKGYGVGVDYTVAKNIVAGVAYYDTESKLADKVDWDLDDQRLLAEINFYF